MVAPRQPFDKLKAKLGASRRRKRNMANSMKVRAGENLAQVWSSVRQRATLAGNPTKKRTGDTRPIHELVGSRDSAPPLIQVPEIISVPGMSLGVMKGVATARQLSVLAQAGPAIEDYDETSLRGFVADAVDMDEALGGVRWVDQRMFARLLNIQNPGRSFRPIINREEWREIVARVGDQLVNTEYWNWTLETKPGGESRFLCHLSDQAVELRSPRAVSSDFALRLVENL